MEWTTPSGHTYTVQADPVPATTWWPTPPGTPCPCDACDQRWVTDDDIDAMLGPDEAAEDLSPAEIEANLAGA